MTDWQDKEIQVVAFAVPFPPDYGGVIDVYYKIRALHRLGIKVHLHAYTYGAHQPAPELEQLCASVHYYPRAVSAKYLQGWPYIVASRYNANLISKVRQIGQPVLLEGLHTAFLVPHLREFGIRHALRLHNVEWKYYLLLAEGERSYARKRYFLEESRRLKGYERILAKTPLLTLSPLDTGYARHEFPAAPVTEILPFHSFDQAEILMGEGEYALFHGNLSVNENEEAALWLIREVFTGEQYPLVIAGKNPGKALRHAANAFRHVRLIENPSEEDMLHLLQHAQVHLLPNRQPTGMKLKWVNALHTARFIIAHPDMAAGLSGKAGIYSAITPQDYFECMNIIRKTNFYDDLYKERLDVLDKSFSNSLNAKMLGNQNILLL